MIVSLCSIRVICIVAAAGLSGIPLLQAIGIYNNVAAQLQYYSVNVHINKGDTVLGNYGVIVSDDTTGDKRTSFHTDSIDSPSSVIFTYTIQAYDGDKLIACAMKLSTHDIACDSQFANQMLQSVDFYIDMNSAQQLNDQSGGGGGGGGVDQFQP